MRPRNRSVRSLTHGVPPNSVMGRQPGGNGSGAMQFITPNDMALMAQGGSTQAGGAGGVQGLSPIADGQGLANTSGVSAVPIGTGLSTWFDYIFGATRGMLLSRGAALWQALSLGTTGRVLKSNGTDPGWGFVDYSELTGTPPTTASPDWDGPLVGAWGDGGWGEGGWGDQWYNIEAPPIRGRLLAADGAFPGIAPYWSNVGDDGARITYKGGNYSINTFGPANPTGTASGTFVMMGLGSTVTFTPLTSGQIEVLCSGVVANTVTGSGFWIQFRVGTGAAPANGVAATGTLFGNPLQVTGQTGTGTVPFPLIGFINLTVGTTYWLDLSLVTTAGGGTTSLSGLTFIIKELP